MNDTTYYVMGHSGEYIVLMNVRKDVPGSQ